MSVQFVSRKRRSLAPILLALGIAAQTTGALAADPDRARPSVVVQTQLVKRVRAKRLFSLSRVMSGEMALRQISTGKRGLSGRLLGLLSKIERNFGRPVTVTSGCRSHAANRRAGGARGSYHMRCMAADIRVPGVSEGTLLRYAAHLHGAGGVGTYCGNSIVHIDVGPKRAWTGGCGRKKRRR